MLEIVQGHSYKKALEDGLALDKDYAIKLIESFEFITFEHEDLDNSLIEQTQLDWNIKGKKKKYHRL